MTGKFLFLVVFFIGFGLIGYQFVSRSKDSTIPRNPAAIPKTQYFDFSKLESGDLEAASRKRLLRGSHLIARKNRIGITLGHFIMRDESGQSVMACDYYDKIQMDFEAEGMAVSGDRPRMTIEAPCSAGEDQSVTRTIWLPLDEILANPPADGDISILQEMNLVLSFKNLDFMWPEHWVLSKVRLLNQANNKRELLIEREEIYRISDVPMTLSLKIKQ